MGLRVTFELDDNDLKHFRLIMRQARTTATRTSPEDIVAAAEDLLASIGPKGVPAFVAERLQKLRMLIDMLSDIEWRLPQREAGGPHPGQYSRPRISRRRHHDRTDLPGIEA